MLPSKQQTMPLSTELDIVRVRQAARIWARDAGFGLVDQTKIATAASELARNTVTHGRGGDALFEVVEKRGRSGLSMSFRDDGPGISDVSLALTDGFSSTGSLGHGLGGARRLSHEFAVDTHPGGGTTVTITMWR